MLTFRIYAEVLMDIILIPVLNVARILIGLYTWVVVMTVILNWLIIFKIINVHNQFMRSFLEFLFRLTDPLLSRIRQLIPFVGGMDLSPMLLLLGLYFFQEMLTRILLRML
ncbi:MAG: YggT family protein [Alphaproteobacteria bacterium]